MKVQIILAGVGGQGILFASRLFSEWGLKLGLGVLGSETHGMAQRGGSVIAHLKLGDFQSPLIREGTADILYSFEQNETYKTLRFLRDDGICFANFPDSKNFDVKIEKQLKDREIGLSMYDADKQAMEIGAIVSANIILIGFSVGTGLVPFKPEDLKAVLKRISPERFLAKNYEAFELGLTAGARASVKGRKKASGKRLKLQKARTT